MVNANDIVNEAIAIHNEKCGYIWGKYGQVWTQAQQTAVENDPSGREQTKKWGARWIGKRVFDCSGLWYYIMKKFGSYVYHGSNTMWNKYCMDKGKIVNGKKENGEELKPGTAVFLYKAAENNRHHVGVYIGGGKCIEAKGTYYGVVQSDISHWDEWGEIKDVDYGNQTEEPSPCPEGYMNLPTLKKGNKETMMANLFLQILLIRNGYDVGGLDGVFGTKTQASVRAFQKACELKVDGVVGLKTWACLLATIGTRE